MNPGPLVIGGTGGSGTRVFARLARAGGVYLGTNLNESEDQLDVAAYYDRWINRWLVERDEVEAMMRAELDPLVARHLRDRTPGAAWGWKEPRSLYLLPFLDRALDGLRFLHVVRDGRDMAFSANQNQLRKHGATVLGAEGEIEPRRSIALWARANETAAEYGEDHMAARYLRLRFEDLLDEPRAEGARIAGFIGGGGALEAAVGLERPRSVGAWRSHDGATVAELERVAGPALRRFGYL